MTTPRPHYTITEDGTITQETTTSPHLAPTSPQTPGATSKATSPLAPHPYGGRGRWNAPTTNTPPTTSPHTKRGEVNTTRKEPTMNDTPTTPRCPAGLLIAGQHYPCDTLTDMATGSTNHDGWAHSNRDAKALWTDNANSGYRYHSHPAVPEDQPRPTQPRPTASGPRGGGPW